MQATRAYDALYGEAMEAVLCAILRPDCRRAKNYDQINLVFHVMQIAPTPYLHSKTTIENKAGQAVYL